MEWYQYPIWECVQARIRKTGDDLEVTENETPLLSYSIYFYGRTTYIVIIAEPHMKPASEYTEMDL